MITSINEDVKVYHRKGQPRDFEVAYKKLDEFVDVRYKQVRKSTIKYWVGCSSCSTFTTRTTKIR